MDNIVSDLEDIKLEMETAKKKRDDVLTSRKDLNQKHQNASLLIDNATSTLKLYKIGFYTGLLMTFAGFVLWYKRYQKYQDDLIKNQAQAVTRNQSD